METTTSLRDNTTAIVRTLMQFLWGYLIAKALALPGLAELGLHIDSLAVQAAIVGASTAFVMGLVDQLATRVHSAFGHLFLISKKPTYVTPPEAPLGPEV